MEKAGITNKFKILYVDSEIHNLSAFTAYFRIYKRFELYVCKTEEEAIDIVNNEYIDVIIADQKEMGVIGIEFLQKAQSKNEQPLKMIVTAHKAVTLLEDARSNGYISSFHEKPMDWESIRQFLENELRGN